MVKGRGNPEGCDPALEADGLDGAYSALASGVRRQILTGLRRGPLAVAELLDGLAVSGPALSKHLKALEAAGLVARTRDGRQHRIRRVAGALGPARAWLAEDAAGAAPLRPVGPAPVPLATPSARAQARALAASLEPGRALVAAALDLPAATHPRPSRAGAQDLPAVGLSPPWLGGDRGSPVRAYRQALLRRRLQADPALAALLQEALAGADDLAAAVPGLDSRQASELESLTRAASRFSWLLTCHPALADLDLLAPAA